MLNTPALYLAMMAQAVPKQEAVSADEQRRIAAHLVRHQEADGSWAWSSAPPGNRPPPHFESDEVATLLGCLALGPHVHADAKDSAEARESRAKGTAWLAKSEPTDTAQADGLRLLVTVRAGESAEALRPRIDRLLGRQNKDGGWGQLRDLPSDAYATGQALYVLGQAGESTERADVRRGADFLVASQRPDGSWPMKSRCHPGAKPSTNPVPITYFGSAWATLGLMRSVRSPVEAAETRSRPGERLTSLIGMSVEGDGKNLKDVTCDASPKCEVSIPRTARSCGNRYIIMRRSEEPRGVRFSRDRRITTAMRSLTWGSQGGISPAPQAESGARADATLLGMTWCSAWPIPPIG
jgi:Squalene-hopene cyclase C-terminal domain